MLTPVAEIHEALREAYMSWYYESLYRQLRYAFGEKWDDDDGQGGARDGDFPDFPAIRVKSLGIGQSRRILTTSFVDLTRNMYSPGEPEFPQVDKFTAEIRKEFWLRRSEEGDWDTARCRAFLEGNGVGVGFLQVGHRINPVTKRVRVHVRHSPTCNTLWDPHEPSAGNSGYICFVQYMPVNRAVSLYGEKIRQYVETADAGNGHKMRTVRIFEYYDLGHGLWEPTRAVIPQKMTNEPIKVEKSLWTERLPFAHYEHVLMPGMSRPVGRIPLQMPTQEALNEIEGLLRACSKTRPVDVWDPTFVDPNDFAKVQNGTTNQVRTKTPLKPGQLPMTRIPAEEISGTAMTTLRYLQQQFNEESGTTEYDRGGKPEGDLTAFESDSIQRSSARQGGWSDKQTDKFAIRTIDTVLYGATLADNDPVEVDLFGSNVLLNDPENPDLSVSEFFTERSRTLIREGSLQFQDKERQGAVRIGQLRTMEPLVGKTISIEKYTEELLRAIGENDPASWMQPMPPPLPTDANGNPVDPTAPPQEPVSAAPMAA